LRSLGAFDAIACQEHQLEPLTASPGIQAIQQLHQVFGLHGDAASHRFALPHDAFGDLSAIGWNTPALAQ